MDDIGARLDRVESIEQIRGLVARYALALDSRDVPALVALFDEQVNVGDGHAGREALAEWFDPILRPYRITVHFVANHIIELTSSTEDEDGSGADTATGLVYCRPEHQVGEKWVVMPLIYHDRYVRRDGGPWRFVSRKPKVFYAADVADNPMQVDDRFDFPGNPLLHHASLPEAWPSWQRFWDSQSDDNSPVNRSTPNNSNGDPKVMS